MKKVFEEAGNMKLIETPNKLGKLEFHGKFHQINGSKVISMQAYGFNSYDDPFNNTGHQWGKITIKLAEANNVVPLPDKLMLRRYHLQVNAAYLYCKLWDNQQGIEITCMTRA